MLSEVIVSNGPVSVVIATMILGFVANLVKDIFKYLRDRKADKDNLEIQKSIDDNIKDLVKGQVQQNGKLATVIEVNKAYHDQLIGISNFQYENIVKGMEKICKADCIKKDK